jgi:uncharacterized membrane protein
METGWDPDVKKYFIKILNSISFGLLWLMACVTAGIYYGFAYTDGKPVIYTILFYTGMALSLFFLLRYYYRAWRK